jgi:hypothetical protein
LFNQPKAVGGVKVNLLRYNVGEEVCNLNFFWGNPLGKLPFGRSENNSKMELTAWYGIHHLQSIAVQLDKFSQVY